MQEVDAHEIAFLLGQLAVLRRVETAGRAKFIDDVM